MQGHGIYTTEHRLLTANEAASMASHTTPGKQKNKVWHCLVLIPAPIAHKMLLDNGIEQEEHLDYLLVASK
jgi:hypothetical protein